MCYRENRPLFSTGKMLYDAGVIPGADMTVECALTKLAYVIAQVDLSDVANQPPTCCNLFVAIPGRFVRSLKGIDAKEPER
jgi:hypothetical protein